MDFFPWTFVTSVELGSAWHSLTVSFFIFSFGLMFRNKVLKKVLFVFDQEIKKKK